VSGKARPERRRLIWHEAVFCGGDTEFARPGSFWPRTDSRSTGAALRGTSCNLTGFEGGGLPSPPAKSATASTTTCGTATLDRQHLPSPGVSAAPAKADADCLGRPEPRCARADQSGRERSARLVCDPEPELVARGGSSAVCGMLGTRLSASGTWARHRFGSCHGPWGAGLLEAPVAVERVGTARNGICKQGELHRRSATAWTSTKTLQVPVPATGAERGNGAVGLPKGALRRQPLSPASGGDRSYKGHPRPTTSASGLTPIRARPRRPRRPALAEPVIETCGRSC